MSQPPRTDDALLHRYHDGELDADERSRVAAGLERDPEARDKLAALDDIGALLRASYGAAAVSAPAAPAMPAAGDRPLDVWPAVERGIAESKVIPITRRARRVPLWASTIAAAAAALAVILVLPSSAHPSNDCVVDELEVSGASATILQLADDSHGGSTTVIWLEEQS